MPDLRGAGERETGSFTEHWLAETIRLREALWGPLDDAKEVRRARAEGNGFPERLLLRARYLAKREKLDLLVERWRRGSRGALAAMGLAALMAGAAAASGALGDGSRSVNVLLAMTALLGLNTLALVFWLLGFLVKGASDGSWLGEAWLWLTRKLARGPDAALAPRALAEVLGRNRAMRWLLGSVSHGWWSLALGSALLTLLAVLSARRYSFNWETTLLSPDAFVWLTATLGWLPAHLGFAIPPDALVRASDGLQTLPEPAQALWSSWLIGCVVVYGLLPRLALLAISLLQSRRRLTALRLDTGLPGYAELRDRLSPTSEKTAIDAPAGATYQTRVHPRERQPSEAGQSALLGIELPPEQNWPPQTLPPGVADLGVIDNRQQRNELMEHLQTQAPGKLLLVCDVRQTPDRGTLALLTELAGLSAQSHIALPATGEGATDMDARTASWHEKLQVAGFTAEQIHIDMEKAMQWLGDERKYGVETGGTHVGR